MPKDSTLNIGSIKSELDLSIIFENVKFLSNNKNFILTSPKIKISPRLSISEPIDIIAEELNINGIDFNSNIKNLQANVLFSNKETSQISIIGAINEVTNSDSIIFSDLEFLLEGINAQNKKINIKATSINFVYSNNYGSIKLSGNNFNGKGNFNKQPSMVIDFEILN